MRVRFLPVNNQVILILIVLFIVLFFPGCNREPDELYVSPPVSHPLLREYIGYGVVTSSFSHILIEPGSTETSLGHLRRGTVVRIMERKPVMNRGVSEFWIYGEGNFEGENILRGWLMESDLEVYDSEPRARTASRSMSQ